MGKAKRRRSRRHRRIEKRLRLAAFVTVALVIAFLAWVFVGGRGAPSGSLEAARAALAKGDYRTATVNLKAVLQQHPNQALVRHELGRTYVLMSQPDAALKEFERARDLGHGGEAFEQDFIEALILNGDTERAITQLAIHARPDDVRWQILQGRVDLSAGRLEQAKQVFVSVLELEPSNDAARRGLARAEFGLGDYDSARESIDQALSSHPDNVELILLKARIALQEKNFADAEVAFSRVLKLRPQAYPAQLGLLAAKVGNRDWPAAQAVVAQLGPRAENEPRALYLQALLQQGQGQPHAAIEILKRVMQIVPKHRDSLRLAALLSVEANNHAAAEEYAQRLLALSPQDETARRLLGVIHLNSGRLESGMKELDLSSDSVETHNDARLLMLLGTAYLKNNQAKLGQKSFERALALGSDTPELKARLALAKFAAGERAAAIEDLEQLVTDHPRNAFGEALLVIAALLHGDLDNAEGRAVEFVEHHSQEAVAHNVLGFVREARGDLDAARDAYTSALEHNRGFHPARFNLARVALKNQDRETAESYFNDVLEQTSGHVQALLNLARLKLAVRDVAAATRFTESALKQNPSALAPMLFASQLYAHLGRYDEALDVAEKAYDRAPSAPRAQLSLVRAALVAQRPERGRGALNDLKNRFPDSLEIAKLELEVQAALGTDGDLVQKADALLSRAPQDPELNIAVGRLALRHDDPARAHTVADKIIAELGLVAAGHVLHGDAYSMEQYWTAARDAYLAAHKDKPSRTVLIKLAATERKLDIDPSPRFTEWLNAHPNDVATRLAYASALQANKQADAAIEHYEEVLERTPTNAAALNNLAWLYAETGDKRAMETASKAHQVAPEQPEIMDTYGWMLLKEERFEQAADMLLRAHERLPENPDIKFHLAMLYVKTGEQKNAKRLLKEILQPGTAFDSRQHAERLQASLGAR